MRTFGPSRLRTPSRVGLLTLLVAAGTAGHAAGASTYRVEDLSSYGSNAGSAATAINDAGGVTCTVSSAGTHRTSAYLWEDGAVWNLGTAGGGSSRAFGISSTSQVVGAASTSDGRTLACLWN